MPSTRCRTPAPPHPRSAALLPTLALLAGCCTRADPPRHRRRPATETRIGLGTSLTHPRHGAQAFFQAARQMTGAGQL
ncbi:hypothetical protein ACGF13_11735 [Kitasatospora sp. NPDC048286]|uniref:hypothetical protein n=1 Tax=unclassified Kitasatospora TaxID=2633591 RepID=UPI003720DC90